MKEGVIVQGLCQGTLYLRAKNSKGLLVTVELPHRWVGPPPAAIRDVHEGYLNLSYCCKALGVVPKGKVRWELSFAVKESPTFVVRLKTRSLKRVADELRDVIRPSLQNIEKGEVTRWYHDAIEASRQPFAS